MCPSVFSIDIIEPSLLGKIALSSVSPVQNPVFYPAIDKKIRTEGFNRNKGYFYATWSPKEGLRYSFILLDSSQEIL
jgi:hypothetical protein